MLALLGSVNIKHPQALYEIFQVAVSGPMAKPSVQMRIACSSCGSMGTYQSSLAGKLVSCPQCKSDFGLPRIVHAKPIAPGLGPQAGLLDSLPASRGLSASNWVSPVAPMRRPQSPGRRASSGAGKFWKILAVLLASVVAMSILGVGVVALIGAMSVGGISSLAPDAIPVPNFPELGLERFVPNSNVTYYNVALTGRVGEPGDAMRFRVYMPEGQHAENSLPCVLLAPAGTNLLHGNAVDDDNYHDEALPYAKSGMVVVMYSLDGYMTVDPDSGDMRAYVYALSQAYKKFLAAKAGVVNGRNAVELVLKRLPQVDPARIYSAGHSSAGTASLLLGAFEKRLAGSIAFAPVTDLKVRLAELTRDRDVTRLLPRLTEYLTSGSPISYVDKYEKPLFVFHARDDSNEPFRNTEHFVTVMKSSKAKLTFAAVNTGDHYQSMIDQGIPQAIKWIQDRPQ